MRTLLTPRSRALRHLAAGGLMGVALWCVAAGPLQGQPAGGQSADRLPVPRFASLKSDNVQVRQGPGTEFPVTWVFRQPGLPVEITKEDAAWSEVRDSEGATGWVWSTSLSRRRTALVLRGAKAQGEKVASLRDDDRENASTLAHVEAGVLAGIIACDGRWCRISVSGFRGYIEQRKLWGTSEGEIIKE